MGHPILQLVAKEVPDPTAPEVRALVRDMLETMIDADGAGLAAPQVHEPWRIVIFQAPAERQEGPEPQEEQGEEAYDHRAPLTVLINPEIELLGEAGELGWEGCLSVPGLRGLVPRHDEIIYRGLTLDGDLVERRARGFHARVVQHECDHLDGILYPQRMRDMRDLIFNSEIKNRLACEAERTDESEEEPIDD